MVDLIPNKYFNPVVIIFLLSFLFYGSKELWQTVILIIILIIFTLIKIIGSKENRKFALNKYFLAFILTFALFYIISLIFTINLNNSVENVYRFLLFFILILYLLNNYNENDYSFLFNVIVALAIINSLFLILAYDWVSFRCRFSFLEGNPNYSGLLNNIALVILVVRVILNKIKLKYFLQLLPLILILLFASFLINSRTLYISLFVLASIVIYIKYGFRKALIFILICAILFIFLPQSITKIGSRSYGRLLIWMIAIKAAAFQPFSGVGLWNFGYAYEMNKIADNVSMFNYSHYGRFAHNDFLQIGVEFGVLCLTALLWALIKLIYNSIKIVKEDSFSRNSISFSNSIISGFLIITYTIHMSFNFVVYHTTLLIFAAVPVAYIISRLSVGSISVKKPLIIVILFSILLLPAFRIVASDIYSKYGRYDAAQRINPYDEEHHLNMYMKGIENNISILRNFHNVKEAFKCSPYDNSIRLLLAKLTYNLSKQKSENMDLIDYFKEAENLLIDDMRLFPTDPFFPNLLGKMYFNKGDYLSSMRMFNNAVCKEPNYFESRFYIGMCFNKLGLNKEAVRVLEKLMDDYKTFGQLPPKSGYERTITSYDKNLADKYMNKINAAERG
ncbi:MAG: O-antigen ligase family protein [bacterium]